MTAQGNWSRGEVEVACEAGSEAASLGPREWIDDSLSKNDEECRSGALAVLSVAGPHIPGAVETDSAAERQE